MNCIKVAATHKTKSKKTKNKNDADEVSRSSGSHFGCAPSWANFKSWSRVRPLRRHCLHATYITYIYYIFYIDMALPMPANCACPRAPVASVASGSSPSFELWSAHFHLQKHTKSEEMLHIHNMDHGYSLVCCIFADLNWTCVLRTPEVSFCDWVSSIRCVLVGGILKLRVCEISCPWRRLGRHGGSRFLRSGG